MAICPILHALLLRLLNTKPNYSPWVLSVITLSYMFPLPYTNKTLLKWQALLWFRYHRHMLLTPECVFLCLQPCFAVALHLLLQEIECSIHLCILKGPGTSLWRFSQSGSSKVALWINESMCTLKWTKVADTVFILKTCTSPELSLKKSFRVRSRTWELLNADFFSFPSLSCRFI